MLARSELERRPAPRDRSTPSVGAESVERLIPAMRLARAEREERRLRRAMWGNPPDLEHVWLDTATVAAMFRMGRKWVIKQIRLERMPATHHGGQWWIRREHAEVIAAARAFTRKADQHQAQDAW